MSEVMNVGVMNVGQSGDAIASKKTVLGISMQFVLQSH